VSAAGSPASGAAIPRLVFANIASSVMISVFPPEYGRRLNGVSPRVIWTAREGDVLVTGRPISPALRDYACAVLGMDPGAIENLAPESGLEGHLAHAVRQGGLYERIAAAVRERPGIAFAPFALDREAVELGRALGLRFDGYPNGGPGDALVERVYELNTKSGFRRSIGELGFPVAPGAACSGAGEVAAAARRLWPEWEAVVAKLDRASNGFGHRVLHRPAAGAGNEAPEAIDREVAAALADLADQPQRYTVEAYLAVAWMPSVEVEVDDAGPRITYVSDQRCPNHSFAGLLTPPVDTPAASLAQLEACGMALGGLAFRLGYRGIFDVDACVTADGAVYATETNFRQTGGTYLHHLAQRILGDDYWDRRRGIWWHDALPGADPALGFEGAVAAIAREGAAFDPARRRGVLPLVDTAAIDGKWRYVLFADGVEEAVALEAAARRALAPGLASTNPG